MARRSTRTGMVRRTARRAYSGFSRARTRGSASLSAARDTAIKAATRARKLSKELKDPMEATKNGGMVLAGSALSGFAAGRGWIPPTIMDIESDPIIGLALGAAGFALKRKELVYLGTGFLAPYVADYARNLDLNF